MIRRFFKEVTRYEWWACAILGFASGIPLYLLVQMLQVWMRDLNIDLKTIGIFSMLTMPYSFKFLWAPLLDVKVLKHRRKFWTGLTQLLLFFCIAGLAFIDPKSQILQLGALAFLIATISATQDISIDAYRREILSDKDLGMGNALAVNAYRLSGLIPGSLALFIATDYGWPTANFVVASFYIPLFIATMLFPEPKVETGTKRIPLIEPLKEFFTRKGVQSALLVLAFLFFYKLGDTMATAISSAFYIDMGFTKKVIGSTAKVAGLWSSVVGGFLGGFIMLRIGINKALWAFGIVQMVTILGFALLTFYPGNQTALFWVVSAEYLGVGLGTSAFVSFIARETNKEFTATQFALLSAVTALPRNFAGGTTGFLVVKFEYFWFFLLCTLCAIPGMLLLFWVAPFFEEEPIKESN